MKSQVKGLCCSAASAKALHAAAMCAICVKGRSLTFWSLQTLLTPEHAVVAETGDSWFNCLKLKLPDGCGCAAAWLSFALLLCHAYLIIPLWLGCC